MNHSTNALLNNYHYRMFDDNETHLVLQYCSQCFIIIIFALINEKTMFLFKVYSNKLFLNIQSQIKKRSKKELQNYKSNSYI